MILGPDEIIKCPSCKAPYLKQSLISGNTFGGMYFSDGQRFFPMLPEQPQITFCDSCHHFFWLKDVSSEEMNPDQGYDEDLSYARWMVLEEYIQAISLKVYRNAKEEIYLRTHLWWVLNNLFRRENRKQEPDQQSVMLLYEENLQALLRLRQMEDPKDLLVLAEIHRELGLFDEALALLKEIKEDRQKDFAAQIREKTIQKDRFMFEMN